MRLNPKARLVKADVFARDVAVWRVAAAVRSDAVGKPVPTVTVEASNVPPPWDDIVEEWPEGLHVWQIKSGAAITKDQFIELCRTLRDALPFADATLAVRVNPRVPTVADGLHELDGLLRSLRNGGALAVTDGQGWPSVLVEACGDTVAAESVGRRLHLESLGNFDGALSRARQELECVYELDAVQGVLSCISATVDATVGHAISPLKLRREQLSQFESRRRFGLAADVSSHRRAYLEALLSSLDGRRILRQIGDDGMRVQDVWCPLSLFSNEMDVLDAGELIEFLHDGKVHVVTGPAGSGKTEVLARLAALLGTRARQSIDAPLPLFLRASDLATVGHVAFAKSSEFSAHGTGDPLAELLSRPSTRWALLIDGVDEVAQGAELVEAVARVFPGATIVVSSRPAIGRALSPISTFTIQPWNGTQGELFLRQFVRRHSVPLDTLLQVGSNAGSLLDRPLTATLVALVLLNGESIPTSRTMLFQRAVSVLVEQWAESRRTANQWKASAPQVRALALECVKGQRQSISREELRQIARKIAPDAANQLHHAVQNDFGLLIPTENGYEFLLRGVAEYLAAEQLSTDEGTLLEACSHAWGAESGRHGLVLLADSDPLQFPPLIRRLLPEGDRTSLLEGGALRRLLVTILAASDVGESASPVAKEISDRAFTAISDESSPWRSDAAADAIAELVRGGDTCWLPLQDRLVELLNDTRTPGGYYRALGDLGIDSWIDGLFHCDPEVRAEAIHRLACHVEHPRVLHALFLMLCDSPSHPCWSMRPAIAAGLALRTAHRDGPIARYIGEIRRLSETSNQLAAAAAAAALRPGEQTADVLARGLLNGASGQYVPDEVLFELGQTEEGAAALDDARPDWRTYRLVLPQLTHCESREPVPASSLTRRRIVRATRHGLRHGMNAGLSSGPARDLYLDALCESGLLEPRGVLLLLSAPPDRLPLLSVTATDWLARVAVRHAEVRERLIGFWPEFARSEPARRMCFPGRALEPFVAQGDVDATEAYAEWLPFSFYVSGMYSGPPPNPDVFRTAPVQLTARAVVDRVWVHATLGSKDSSGQQTWLAPGSTASVLRQLGPSWHGQRSMTAELMNWINGHETIKRVAALSALEGAPLTDEERSILLAAAVASLTLTSKSHKAFTVPQVVQLAQAHRLTAQLIPELTTLVTEQGPSTIGAACALLAVTPHENARALSILASARGFNSFDFDRIDQQQFADLVAVAPKEWGDAVIRHVKQQGMLNLGSVLPIFAALPPVAKRTVALQLRDLSTESDALPWCARWDSPDIYRPLDLVDRLLFDAGAD